VKTFSVLSGPDWIHEIEHDGYRLTVHREGKRVRLFTRNGHDWRDRYPLIVEAALRIRIGSFVPNGEAVCSGWPVDQTSMGFTVGSVYALDVLMSDGDDLRKLPLSMRKTNLDRLLALRINGIFLSDFERGGIGPDLFRHACMLGLEGLVSKRNDRPYCAGVSPNWVKVKNPEHPAIQRVKDAFR
jgi:bifunctional non-homologous end joining protein LigD